VKQRNALPDWIGKLSVAGLFLLAFAACGWTQTAGSTPPEDPKALVSAVHDLQQQVTELRSAVAEVRAEAAQYRAETAALRRELESVRAPGGSGEAVASAEGAAAGAPSSANEPLEHRVASLEEASSLSTAS
jgi:regulator of replication initiation timing